MEQKRLALWMKIMIIGSAICGVILYRFLDAGLIADIEIDGHDFVSWYWPWKVLISVSAVPCYMILFQGWKITTNVGNNKSFCAENAFRLEEVSRLAALVAAILFIGNIVFWLLARTHLVILLGCGLVCFIMIAISVGMAVLSHLILKASKLQEETELTI